MSNLTHPHPPIEDSVPEGPSVILRKIWRIAIHRRWTITSVFLITLIATVLITIKQQRIYSSTCTILIDLAAPRVLDNAQVQDVVESGPGSYWYTREYYETQYKLISTRAVAARVVEKLHLADDARFLGIEHVQDPALREKRR